MKSQTKSFLIQAVTPILAQYQTVNNQENFCTVSWKDHHEAMKLCLGFYTFTITHVFMCLPWNEQAIYKRRSTDR